MNRPSQPSLEQLQPLLTRGWTRLPAYLNLNGAIQAGLCWQADTRIYIATPQLLRIAQQTSTPGEAVALLLACNSDIRKHWLNITATRLKDLGQRHQLAALCQEITILGETAYSLNSQLDTAKLSTSPFADLELTLFGAPAEQAAATPKLNRVLGLTAPLIEGKRGNPPAKLPPIDPQKPDKNWDMGRILQTPDQTSPSEWILSGQLSPYPNPDQRMEWVIQNPWALLLAQLVFLAEYWSAEGSGKLQLELPPEQIVHYYAPSRVQIVVTLANGREVECGSLGELCQRALDALDMALVPNISKETLDQQLADLIRQLQLAQVWRYVEQKRPCYQIGPSFSRDTYRQQGFIFNKKAGFIAEILREVCLNWARSLLAPQGELCV